MATLPDSVSFASAATLPVSGLVASSRLTPEIGLEDSWHNLAYAAIALREWKVNGKAVLDVD